MPAPGTEVDAAPNVYWQPVLPHLPRLLSWGNRESVSPLFGCFDRTFWAWKFTDFPGARFQEAAYALAHLWATPYPGNPLAANARALAWCRAAMRYWVSLQHADGSFDEAYPYERSLAATAFTGFYVGEACLLVSDSLPEDERAALRSALTTAGDWLCRNDEQHGVLSNHLAAAAAALAVLNRITGDDRYAARSRYFIDRILAHQSPEGWYEEYGGADPGYQTHGSFYLARVWQLTQDAELLDSLRRATAFLTHFIHPDATLGGEYASRNTEFYFPAAFEMLASALPDATAMTRFLRPAVAAQTVAGLWAMDAYNLLPMLNNYLFAAANARDVTTANAPLLPCEREGEWSFPDAGLFVRSSARYFAIVGLSKGGVVKAFDRRSRRIAGIDDGWWLKLRDGRLASHQMLTRPATWRRDGDALVVDAPFFVVRTTVFSPLLFLAFRAFNLTFGQLPRVAYWVKNLLVTVLVRPRRALPIGVTRRIEFGADRITIRDRLDNSGKLAIEKAGVGAKFATIHMGSSRYYHAPPSDCPESELDAASCAALSHEGRIEFERVWTFPE